MKEVADFVRHLTPNLSDKERYNFVSSFHFWYQNLAICLFFIGSLYVKLIVVALAGFTLYMELVYRECPISILEREFSKDETWEDLIDVVFKYFDWKLNRSEKVVGFTCFYMGIVLILGLSTLYELIKSMSSFVL